MLVATRDMPEHGPLPKAIAVVLKEGRQRISVEDTLVILQTWESKEAADKFQAALPPEKTAMFQSLMSSRTMCWHDETLALPSA